MSCRKMAKDKGGKGQSGFGFSVTKVWLIPLICGFSPDVDAEVLSMLVMYIFITISPLLHIVSSLSHPIVRIIMYSLSPSQSLKVYACLYVLVTH